MNDYILILFVKKTPKYNMQEHIEHIFTLIEHIIYSNQYFPFN